MLLPLRDENPHPPGWRPIVTYGLIIANVAVFFIEVAATGQFLDFTNIHAYNLFYNWGAVPQCIMGADVLWIDFGLGPETVECNNPPLTLITSTFMHGGILHLGGNMLFLWIFGDNIEQKFGRFRFLGIYLAWGVLAGLAHVVGDINSAIPAVGASGAVSGVLGAYLVLFPRAKILTFMMMFFFWRMIHIQAKWFLPFWLIFQNILPFMIGSVGFGVAGGGIAYLAHIGGFVVGLAVGYLYKITHRSDYLYGSRYGYRPDY